MVWHNPPVSDALLAPMFLADLRAAPTALNNKCVIHKIIALTFLGDLYYFPPPLQLYCNLDFGVEFNDCICAIGYVVLMRVILLLEDRSVLYKIITSSDRKIELLILSNTNQHLLEPCNVVYTLSIPWSINNEIFRILWFFNERKVISRPLTKAINPPHTLLWWQGYVHFCRNKLESCS